jgi:hypothetical protein
LSGRDNAIACDVQANSHTRAMDEVVCGAVATVWLNFSSLTRPAKQGLTFGTGKREGARLSFCWEAG